MSEVKENNKEKSPILRQPRKSGGSLVIALTEFLEENAFYAVSKIENEIILQKVEIKIPEKNEFIRRY